MDILCRLFLVVIDVTAAASIVILLVMAITKWFHRHMSARFVDMLWLIVLVRLVVPVFPSSPVSVFHLFQMGFDLKPAVSQLYATVQVPHDSESTQWKGSQNQSMNGPGTTDLLSIEGRPSQEFVNREIFVHTYPVSLQIVSVVWLSGAIAFSGYLILFMRKMRQQRDKLHLVDDPRVLSIMNDCRLRFGIRKPLPVYAGNYAKSPYLSGIFHPWMYLPEPLESHLSDSQLAYVFSHELGHYKRNDIVWNTIGSFALAIHWMNPLVWYCIKQMKSDREIACDSYVLETIGEKEAIPYGLTILECLRRFSAMRDQPNLLYFYGSNNHMARRISMIQSFKKGSYRWSTAAIIGVVILGSMTLTNASTTVQADSVETIAGERDRILFDSSFRSYGNLEKAVKISDFAFKVPSTLPSGYQFESIKYNPAGQGNLPGSEVSVVFEKSKDGIHYGNATFTATAKGNGLDAAIQAIEISETQGEKDREIKKETLSIQGMNAVKVTIHTEHWDKPYYIWQDQGIQYQISGNQEMTNQDLINMITSMEYPDSDSYQQYVNHDLLIEYIYDTGDLQQVPESIGFMPKFPLQLPGSFQAVLAFETKKINFSYPDDEADKKSRLLSIQYKRTDQDKAGVSRFGYLQIKDNNQYEAIQKNGQVAYMRIDGEKNVVKAAPLMVGGREVLKTAAYKIDGALSSPSESDLVSYFWKENGVCHQVTFQKKESGQEDVVLSLMNAKLMTLTDPQ